MKMATTVALLLATALLAGCAEAPSPERDARRATVIADPHDAVLRGPGLPPRGRSCHTRIESGGFYSYSSLAAVRAASCTTTIRTFTALFEQVMSRSRAGEDCYPGFCTLDSPMTSNGFRCTALGLGDGLARVTCRRGPEVIDAAAAWNG
jgi:hypothetical protein